MTHLNNEIGPGVIAIATKRIQKLGNAALRPPVQPLLVSAAHSTGAVFLKLRRAFPQDPLLIHAHIMDLLQR